MNRLKVVADFLKWDQYIHDRYYAKLDPAEDAPENQDAFADMILENLPDQYKHLGQLDEEHYQYALQRRAAIYQASHTAMVYGFR